MATPRLTKPTIGVLEVLFSAADDDPAWGYRIILEAELAAGTVYPILERLTRCGWVTRHEETQPHPSRPARRFYRLTDEGRLATDVALKERVARQARQRLRMRQNAPR